MHYYNPIILFSFPFPFHSTGKFLMWSQQFEIMNQNNKSAMTEFELHSLSGFQELQLFYFALFRLFYVFIVLGNVLTVLTVIYESVVHTPMYFLLSNLSLIDVCLSTFAIPKTIIDFLMEHKTICFKRCMAQIFFLYVFSGG